MVKQRLKRSVGFSIFLFSFLSVKPASTEEGYDMDYSRTRTGQGFGHLPKARQYIQAAHQESGHVLFAQGCRNPYPAGDIRRCPVGTHCASHSYARKTLLLMLLNILLLIFCAIPFGVSMSLMAYARGWIVFAERHQVFVFRNRCFQPFYISLNP